MGLSPSLDAIRRRVSTCLGRRQCDRRRAPPDDYRAEGASATDLAIGVHLARSLATKRVNSAGDIFSVSIPSPARRARSAGVASAATISALSRATISGGRPAGPEKPNQVVATRSG